MVLYLIGYMLGVDSERLLQSLGFNLSPGLFALGAFPFFGVAAFFGTWLIGKDWRDLIPSKRNTSAWGLLPHRVPRD